MRSGDEQLPSRPGRASAACVVGVATVAAGLVYSVFLVAPFLGTPLDPASSYVSELAALDQPLGALFRAVDALVGIVVCLAAVWVVRSSGARAVRGAGTALGLFGIATLVDVAAPMACAPSADARCAAEELERSVLAFGVHEVASAAANGAALVTVVLLVTARTRGRTGAQAASPLECTLLAGLVLVAVPGLLVVVEETVGLGLAAWRGYVQRVQVLALSAMIVTIGVATARGTRWVGPPPVAAA